MGAVTPVLRSHVLSTIDDLPLLMVPVANLVVRLFPLILHLLEGGVIVASYLRFGIFAFGKIMGTTLVLIARFPRLHRPDVPLPLIPLLSRDVRPVIDLLHR